MHPGSKLNALLHLCRALVRTFPRDLRREGFLELPDLIVQLVAESHARRGGWAAARTAAWELGGLILGSVRAWLHRAGAALDVLRPRPLSRFTPDLRLLLLLALRERGGTLALVAIIAVVSGSVATFASLGLAIRADSASVETADRLGWIWADRTWEPDATRLVSDLHLGHLRDRAESFQGLAGLWMVSGRVRGGDRPVHTDVARASANFFDLLEVEPHLGRLFAAGDHRPGAPWVAVLTFDFWRTHFNADPHVIGKRVVVGVPEMEVVGVLPEGFRFSVPDALGPYGAPSVWLPARHRFDGVTLPYDVQGILGLRKVGVSRHAATEELRRLGSEMDATVYDHRGFGYRFQGLPSGRSPGLARAVPRWAAQTRLER